MTDRLHELHARDDADLPPGLGEALRELYPPPDVPRAVDAAILAEARSGFSRRRRWWVYGRAAAGVAAAAAAVVVVAVTYLDRDRATPSPVASSAATPRDLRPGDADGNGRVDVIDALVLAKKVRAGGTPAPGEDVNADGTVDQRDVDAVATMAVRVDAPRQGGLR